MEGNFHAMYITQTTNVAGTSHVRHIAISRRCSQPSFFCMISLKSFRLASECWRRLVTKLVCTILSTTYCSTEAFLVDKAKSSNHSVRVTAVLLNLLFLFEDVLCFFYLPATTWCFQQVGDCTSMVPDIGKISLKSIVPSSKAFVSDLKTRPTLPRQHIHQSNHPRILHRL